jgi:hypothetical protein
MEYCCTAIIQESPVEFYCTIIIGEACTFLSLVQYPLFFPVRILFSGILLALKSPQTQTSIDLTPLGRKKARLGKRSQGAKVERIIFLP